MCFPDGKRVLLPVEWKNEFHSYDDHGHETEVASLVPFVTVSLHGAKLCIRLTDLGAEITGGVP